MAAALAAACLAPAGCRRQAEVPWELPTLSLPAPAGGETPVAPVDGRLLLRRTVEDGSSRSLRLDVTHDVKVRGRGHDPLAITVHEELLLDEAGSSPAGGSPSLAWSVREATVTVDPAPDETVAAMEEDLARVRLVRPPDAAEAGAEAPRQGAEAEVGEALARLLAVLPGREVAPGDTWPLAGTTVRPVDGGGEVRLVREGTARFEGMVVVDERLLALVTGRWRVRPEGRRPAGQGTEGIGEARGEGLGAWRVDPATGATVRSEVAESTLMALDLSDGHRTQGAEQLAVVRAELRPGEAEP